MGKQVGTAVINESRRKKKNLLRQQVGRSNAGFATSQAQDRLRPRKMKRPVIAFFGSLDYRVSYSRFLFFSNFIQIEIADLVLPRRNDDKDPYEMINWNNMVSLS